MWFRKPKVSPAAAAQGLREYALSVTAEDAGITSKPGDAQVWGVLMEIGFPDAVATLASLADGTTSLYFSTGGGVIGAGEHPAVREAATAFIATADAHRAYFTGAAEYPQPAPGRVRFYLRTHEGPQTAEASEEDLREGRHQLAPLFRAGHAVIAAVRRSTGAG
ncbi:MAG: hypothetical protein M3282_12995 [Gemmatimonadota bacterium]|nr:hypothetical protein [Gemmatimonadota bacterium]